MARTTTQVATGRRAAPASPSRMCCPLFSWSRFRRMPDPGGERSPHGRMTVSPVPPASRPLGQVAGPVPVGPSTLVLELFVELPAHAEGPPR